MRASQLERSELARVSGISHVSAFREGISASVPQALLDSLRPILDAIEQPVFAANAQGRPVYVNPAFGVLVGFEGEDSRGCEMLAPDCPHGERSQRFRCALRHASGRAIRASAVCAPLRDAQGSVAGYLGLVWEEPAAGVGRPPSRQQLCTRLARLERGLQQIAFQVAELGVASELFPLETSEFAGLRELSTREWQVLRSFAAGSRVPNVARELHISPHTVRNHLKAIFRKLGVGSQAELIEKFRAAARSAAPAREEERP